MIHLLDPSLFPTGSDTAPADPEEGGQRREMKRKRTQHLDSGFSQKLCILFPSR